MNSIMKVKKDRSKDLDIRRKSILMTNKITVVITAYNIGNTIRTCLRELYNQSFQDFNILIVEDCSNDNTRDEIEKYRALFGERLYILLSEENHGSPGAARNVALNSSRITGKYVLFLDGDDNIEDNMLERLYNEAEIKEADVVCCGYDRVNAMNHSIISVEMNNFYVDQITSCHNVEYIPLINTSLWNKLIRTSCIGEKIFEPIRIGEDACFNIELYRDIHKIVFINDVLIHYNVYETSLMSNVEVHEVVKLSEKMIQIYNSCDKEKYQSALILSAFIHIGISACVRVYQGGKCNINQHLKWTKKYFDDNYPQWYKTDCLKIKFLSKLGLKGYALKVCVYLYRLNLFNIFLYSYTFMIEKMGRDIKW